MSTERGFKILENLKRLRENESSRSINLETHNEQGREISPARYQLKMHEPFGLWKVQGRTFIKPEKTKQGKYVNGHWVPVKCKCGVEKNVRSNQLVNGKSRGCKNCRRNRRVAHKSGSDWAARGKHLQEIKNG